MIILLFIFLILSLGLLLWQISNLISVIFGSPYVMVDKAIVYRALKLAKLNKGEVFYDLGCGNGDVLIAAAKMGAKTVGFEISPYYYIYAKLKTRAYKHVNVQYRNIYKADFSNADVVYCYLLPEMLEKLAPKFRRELGVGSRVISVGFPILEARARKMERDKIGKHKVYIYKY